MEGNARKVEGRYHPRAYDPDKRAALAQAQAPIAAVLACSDSRVPPEILFDQGRGDLFVVRLAGAVASGDGLASLEYAVDHLHVPLIVVLGHEKCGAVAAALTGHVQDGHLGQMIAHIGRHVGDRGLTLEAAVEQNTRASLRDIWHDSAPLIAALRAGRVELVAGVVEIGSGKIHLLGE